METCFYCFYWSFYNLYCITPCVLITLVWQKRKCSDLIFYAHISKKTDILFLLFHNFKSWAKSSKKKWGNTTTKMPIIGKAHFMSIHQILDWWFQSTNLWWVGRLTLGISICIYYWLLLLELWFCLGCDSQI